MNREQWQQFLIEAFTDYRAGNDDALNLVVEVLTQSDAAAEVLKRYGYESSSLLAAVREAVQEKDYA